MEKALISMGLPLKNYDSIIRRAIYPRDSSRKMSGFERVRWTAQTLIAWLSNHHGELTASQIVESFRNVVDSKIANVFRSSPMSQLFSVMCSSLTIVTSNRNARFIHLILAFTIGDEIRITECVCGTRATHSLDHLATLNENHLTRSHSYVSTTEVPSFDSSHHCLLSKTTHPGGKPPIQRDFCKADKWQASSLKATRCCYLAANTMTFFCGVRAESSSCTVPSSAQSQQCSKSYARITSR